MSIAQIAAGPGPQGLQVFALVGTQIWSCQRSGDGWTSWTPLSLSSVAPPEKVAQIAVTTDGVLWLYAIDSYGELWKAQQAEGSWRWSRDTSQRGAVYSQLAVGNGPAAGGQPFVDYCLEEVRGIETLQAGQWLGLEAPQLAYLAAGQLAEGTLRFFGISSASRIYSALQNPDGSWSAAAAFQNDTKFFDVAAARLADGRLLAAAAESKAAQVLVCRMEGSDRHSAWTPWEPIRDASGQPVPNPSGARFTQVGVAPVAAVSGLLCLFATDQLGTVWTSFQQPDNAAGDAPRWSQWSQMAPIIGLVVNIEKKGDEYRWSYFSGDRGFSPPNSLNVTAEGTIVALKLRSDTGAVRFGDPPLVPASLPIVERTADLVVLRDTTPMGQLYNFVINASYDGVPITSPDPTIVNREPDPPTM